MKIKQVRYAIPFVFDANARVLILGTFPSVLSRLQQFYYGNPSNRFYDVLSGLMHRKKPESVEEKKLLLLENRIALGDVLQGCEIRGSSDLSIKNAEPNDLSPIFRGAQIRRVFANGQTACRYYKQFFDDNIFCLPSTSSANAAWGLERLKEAWSVVLEDLRA